MTRERVMELIDAYGADQRRWPVEERATAAALVGADNNLAAYAREAASLDAALAGLDRATPPAWLTGRILQEAEAHRGRRGGFSFLSAFWPFGGAWQPASALAVALAVGIAAGATGTVTPTLDGTSATNVASLDVSDDELLLAAYGGYDTSEEW